MSVAKRVTVGAALLLVSGTAAWGLCPQPVPKVCSTFFESDVVFVGTVVSEEVVLDEDGFTEGWLYRLRVAKVLRGDVGATVTVYTSNDSSRLILEKGAKFLLFATRRNERFQIGNDCGPLSDPSQMAEVLADIAALEEAEDAVVEGEVVASPPLGPGVPGVAIVVQGIDHSYRVMTNTNGQFQIAVPPGRYRVMVDPDVATQSDYNWLDLKNLVLEKGQCAQVQFVKR